MHSPCNTLCNAWYANAEAGKLKYLLFSIFLCFCKSQQSDKNSCLSSDTNMKLERITEDKFSTEALA